MLGSETDDVFKNITHLILDEVHERDVNTDLLMIAVRNALKQNIGLKIVLMSATLDSSQFSDYFGKCPIIHVPGRLFNIEVLYLDQILMETGYNTEEVYQVTNLRQEIDQQLLQHVIMHIHTHNPTDGAILVFLTGYQDIMNQKDLIEKHFYEKGYQNYQLFVLHSAVEELRVFDSMPFGIRKIVLSTNIAETSLTIEDVVIIAHFIKSQKIKSKCIVAKNSFY